MQHDGDQASREGKAFFILKLKRHSVRKRLRDGEDTRWSLDSRSSCILFSPSEKRDFSLALVASPLDSTSVLVDLARLRVSVYHLALGLEPRALDGLRGEKSPSSAAAGSPSSRVLNRRISEVISTSLVMKIWPRFFCSVGQKTGSEAQMVARLTSTAASTMGTQPYQLGSRVGATLMPTWLSKLRAKTSGSREPKAQRASVTEKKSQKAETGMQGTQARKE
ncbi:hypothetical protein ColKHC_05262 [Colletotrichum higginsianum]|nr:hypothetical protein ColKHC_05262 [Colletotrichum higginsianum]